MAAGTTTSWRVKMTTPAIMITSGAPHDIYFCPNIPRAIANVFGNVDVDQDIGHVRSVAVTNTSGMINLNMHVISKYFIA